ncbi:hypothetical protein [Aurantiacibacter poecillastricola]|uniref:hypothetical protein n=1 Tax=Aurantiacibacter poecillastricola TaxID=3064385 RepID=UPI00273F7E93|nr:hypothetical protein [Aurantiacibacter sp. 219JJ12-13]MDP5260711.1 hypothetical protein [Aurantiacibacter sp. 219JJ12-13]
MTRALPVISHSEQHGNLMQRQPLTTTHPHGYVLARPDRALGLIRISKNASTESKVRLECEDWLPFHEFGGPVVAFLREPVARFLSSVPETILRMTDFASAQEWRMDRVVIPDDVHLELLDVAKAPIPTVLERFVELVEYAFFDAHHEPQHAFLADRHMALRIDPYLYLTETFETAIGQIENRFGIDVPPAAQRGNVGGRKAEAGRNGLVDVARRVSSTGVYREVTNPGFLGRRYGDGQPVLLRELNGYCNKFVRELKSQDLPADLRQRICDLYAFDLALWQDVTSRGGDVRASDVWPRND